MIYSSLNFLNNKANNEENTRDAGDGEQTLRFAIHAHNCKLIEVCSARITLNELIWELT